MALSIFDTRITKVVQASHHQGMGTAKNSGLGAGSNRDFFCIVSTNVV